MLMMPVRFGSLIAILVVAACAGETQAPPAKAAPAPAVTDETKPEEQAPAVGEGADSQEAEAGAKEEINILERVSPTARAAYEKGLTLIGSDANEALAAFQRAATESPELYVASYNAGAILEMQNRFTEAQQAYEQALNAHRGFGPAVVGLASLKMRGGDLAGAEVVLTKHVESGGVMVRSALAVLLARLGKLDGARDHAIAVLHEDERNARAMLAMGMLYRRKEMYELATMALNQAIDIDDGLGEAFAELGLVLVAKDEKALAVQAFERAAAASPQVAAILNNLGALRNEVGAFKGAIEVLEKAIAIEGERPEYHLNLGNAYRGDQRIVDAEKAYSRALEVGGGAPGALFNLGVLYLDNEMPDKDLIVRYQQCIRYLKAYESKVTASEAERAAIGEYIATAEKAIEQEERRQKRDKEREERKKQKEAEDKAQGETAATKAAEAGDDSSEEPTEDLGGEAVADPKSDVSTEEPPQDIGGEKVNPTDAPGTGGN